jgi:hypothetical protein
MLCLGIATAFLMSKKDVSFLGLCLIAYNLIIMTGIINTSLWAAAGTNTALHSHQCAISKARLLADYRLCQVARARDNCEPICTCGEPANNERVDRLRTARNMLASVYSIMQDEDEVFNSYQFFSIQASSICIQSLSLLVLLGLLFIGQHMLQLDDDYLSPLEL